MMDEACPRKAEMPNGADQFQEKTFRQKPRSPYASLAFSHSEDRSLPTLIDGF